MFTSSLSIHRRQTVAISLTEARRQFTDSMTAALRALRKDDTERAFRELSTAHEVAGIIVTKHHCLHAIDLQRQTDTAVLIRELLTLTGLTQLIPPFAAKFGEALTQWQRITPHIDTDFYEQQVSGASAVSPMLFFATLDAYACGQAASYHWAH